MSTWTGEILPGVIKNPNGGLTATLQWTDGAKTESKTLDFLNTAAMINTLQKIVDGKNREEAQKAEIAALDTSILVGPLDAVKDVIKPQLPPPPQDELDRRAFQELWLQYRIALAAESAQLPITPDSAAIHSELSKKWKPEYGSMLIGRF